jgi:hypothetical protein
MTDNDSKNLSDEVSHRIEILPLAQKSNGCLQSNPRMSSSSSSFLPLTQSQDGNSSTATSGNKSSVPSIALPSNSHIISSSYMEKYSNRVSCCRSVQTKIFPISIDSDKFRTVIVTSRFEGIVPFVAQCDTFLGNNVPETTVKS